MSAGLEVVAHGQELVVGLADGAGSPVTLFEDQGCTTPCLRAAVAAYADTEFRRTFWVAGAGVYTLTVTQDGADVYRGPVTLASGTTTTVGPWALPAFAGEPGPRGFDGGTP